MILGSNVVGFLTWRKKRCSIANANTGKSLPLASTKPLVTLRADFRFDMMVISILKDKLYTF